LNANITFHTPEKLGPSILGQSLLGGWHISFLPTWRSGSYFTWNPLNKPHLNNNQQWPAYYVWDARLTKAIKIKNLQVEAYVDVTNLFNNPVNMMYTGRPFRTSDDRRDYMASLRLPMYDSAEFDGLRDKYPGYYIAGDDKPGIVYTEENNYVNEPNVDMALFNETRDIWFGLRIIF
jgi:hypothetical protein